MMRHITSLTLALTLAFFSLWPPQAISEDEPNDYNPYINTGEWHGEASANADAFVTMDFEIKRDAEGNPRLEIQFNYAYSKRAVSETFSISPISEIEFERLFSPYSAAAKQAIAQDFPYKIGERIYYTGVITAKRHEVMLTWEIMSPHLQPPHQNWRIAQLVIEDTDPQTGKIRRNQKLIFNQFSRAVTGIENRLKRFPERERNPNVIDQQLKWFRSHPQNPPCERDFSQ